MNYLGLVSICLGLVAILIAVQYMNSSDKLMEEIKYIRTRCIGTRVINKNDKKILEMIKSIQKKNNMSLDDLNTLLEKKVNFKKEGFKNYSTDLERKNTELIYSTAKSRGIIEGEKISKVIDYNKVDELSDIVKDYENLFKKTFQRIQSTDKVNNVGKVFTKELLKKMKTKKKCPINKSSAIPKEIGFVDNHWCKMKHDNKSYCFQVPMKMLCNHGKIVESTKGCDFY